MKTPLQEILKLESYLTHMFDSDQRVAMALLEHIRDNKNEYTEALEDFEGFVRNILDSEELTDKEKVEIIQKEL